MSTADKNTLEIIAHPVFPERARLFYEKYDLKSIIGPGTEAFCKKARRRRSKRLCLFCGKDATQVGFKNDAHLLSQLIGNSSMYSDFECNECNARFSLFEDSLANFIGVSRTFAGLNGEKKTKGFDAKKLVAKSRSFVGDNILIVAPEDIIRDPLIPGKSTFTYQKNKFVPAHVYKAILKGALSLLGPEHVANEYQLALQYLNDQIVVQTGAWLGGYKLSFNLNLPLHVYVFEKRQKDEQIPTLVMCFYFQNNILVLPIPFNTVDIESNNQETTIVWPPPYFTNEGNLAIANPQRFERDFSSANKVEDETEGITLQMDMSSPESNVAYDPVTDKIYERAYSAEGIKYLIMTRDGVTIDPKALSAFIREQMENRK